jgi:RNA-splicing ligase RtcB
MSRKAVRKAKGARQEQRKLEELGIIVQAESRDGLLEELPEGHKKVDEVIEVLHKTGLAAKVTR